MIRPPTTMQREWMKRWMSMSDRFMPDPCDVYEAAVILSGSAANVSTDEESRSQLDDRWFWGWVAASFSCEKGDGDWQNAAAWLAANGIVIHDCPYLDPTHEEFSCPTCDSKLKKQAEADPGLMDLDDERFHLWYVQLATELGLPLKLNHG